jgi:hypothetical protein
MTDYTIFSAWKKFLTGRKYLTDNPFDSQPLGPTPVFLYTEGTTPLPSASVAGVWMAYPSIQKLAAHLRFGLLPSEFSIWLSRDEWDSTPQEPKTAEQIFEGAQTVNNRYIGDIPLMKKVVAELDIALRTDDDGDAWRRVQKACRMFNSRCESTPTWNFVHKPLRGLKALLMDMTVCGSVAEELAEQMKALSTTQLSNRKAQRKLKALLKEAVVL